MRNIILNFPVQCSRWLDPPVHPPNFSSFKTLHAFSESPYSSRFLLECPECGQPYYVEFLKAGVSNKTKFPRLCAWVPINPDPDLLEVLAGLSPFEGLNLVPSTAWVVSGKPREVKRAVNVGLFAGPSRQPILDDAFHLASCWHDGQVRKGDGSPYILHPISVALLLAENGFSAETVAAGFCHDLLEDTRCSPQQITDQCGDIVLQIVKAVTNVELPSWERKKLHYIETVKNGPSEAKAVCLADKICNLRTLMSAYQDQGSALWKKFNRGRDKKLWFERKVLMMLQQEIISPLLLEYESLIEGMAALKS